MSSQKPKTKREESSKWRITARIESNKTVTVLYGTLALIRIEMSSLITLGIDLPAQKCHDHRLVSQGRAGIVLNLLLEARFAFHLKCLFRESDYLSAEQDCSVRQGTPGDNTMRVILDAVIPSTLAFDVVFIAEIRGGDYPGSEFLNAARCASKPSRNLGINNFIPFNQQHHHHHSS